MFTTLPAVNAPFGGAPTAFPKNVTASAVALQLGLEDLLGELQFARRTDHLGRLAFLASCEVRRLGLASPQNKSWLKFYQTYPTMFRMPVAKRS
jgi:hypothetical protein